MPQFLRIPDNRRKPAAAIAEKTLGRKIRRNEAAVLTSGKGVFADSGERDLVTGLYRLHYVELR
jgi:hypothetical protein